MESFPELNTKRLHLKEIKGEHVGILYDLFTNKEILKFYGSDPMTDISEAQELIQKFRVGLKHNTVIRWGIFLKSNGRLIGTCGFHNWNHRYYRAEIGYELSPEYWGNAYMKEAIETIIEYGFEHLDLHRVGALISPHNKASSSLIEKLGFEREGVLKDYAYSGQGFIDLTMYAKIKND